MLQLTFDLNKRLFPHVCVCVCYLAAAQYVCWPITSVSDGVGIIWVPERDQLSQITSPIKKVDSTSELYNWTHCTQTELCSDFSSFEYLAQTLMDLLNPNELSFRSHSLEILWNFMHFRRTLSSFSSYIVNSCRIRTSCYIARRKD